MYNKRTWLNKEDSPSSGSVIAYDGTTTWRNEKIRQTFLHLSDCHTSIRLHKVDDDSMDDFINKMKLLKNEIEKFINYLEENK